MIRPTSLCHGSHISVRHCNLWCLALKLQSGAPVDHCKKTQVETACAASIAKDHNSHNSMKFTEDASGTLVNAGGTAQKECQVKQHGTSSCCGNLWLSGSTHGWIAYKMGISRFASQKKMHYPTYMTTCQGCSQHLIRGEVNTRVEYRGITLPVWSAIIYNYILFPTSKYIINIHKRSSDSSWSNPREDREADMAHGSPFACVLCHAHLSSLADKFLKPGWINPESTNFNS